MTKATSKSKDTITIAAIITVLIISVADAGSVKIAYSQSSNTPNFSLKTLDGKQVSLESFRGKPVMLWFMSTDCPSCFAQVDAVKQLKSEYTNKLDILLIDIMPTDSSQDLQSFLEKFGISQWKATLDTDGVAIKYGIIQTDSTVIVDTNGNIVFKHLGLSDYQQLKDTVAKIIV